MHYLMSEEIKKTAHGGHREGSGRPKGSKQRDGAKNAMRIALIKKRLIDHGLGLVEMTPSQVRAAEVVLDRHEPRLASIEQTNIDPRDSSDPDSLLQQLQALIAEKPHLLELLRQGTNSEKSLEISGSISTALQ